MRFLKKVRFSLALLLVVMFAMSVPVMAKDAAITPPQIITLAPVSLSPELREKYSEKTILVKLRATISESGTTVGDIKIITSSGDESFDQAAIDSLKQSVFRPAYASDYQAVACTIVLPLNVKVEKYLPEEPASSTADPLPEQP